jgi:hypothetical protein
MTHAATEPRFNLPVTSHPKNACIALKARVTFIPSNKTASSGGFLDEWIGET